MFFFAYPFMLLGLIALAVPVIVHLFELRRYRKVLFSNVSQLTALQEATRKESQLRRRLLLAVRLLAIFSVVMAFAGPSLKPDDDMLKPGQTVVSVYIDNSFSMLQQASDGQLFELAKQKAYEVAKAYALTDRFQLISNEMDGTQFHLLDRDAFLSAVDALRPAPNQVFLSDVVRRQAQFVNALSAANKHCYLISDFQQSTTDLDQVDDSLLASGFYTFIPLHAEHADNIFIDTLLFDTPAIQAMSHVTVTARLRNTSDRMVEQVPVYLYVDGMRKAQTTTPIAPHGEASVEMHFMIESEGAVEGCVITVDNLVTFDDTLFFAFNVQHKLKTLELYDDRPNPNLERLIADDSTISFRSARAAEGVALLASSAKDEAYDCLFIDELTTIPTALSNAIVDYVGRGGTLVVIPAEKADVEQYNALLQELHAPLLERFERRQVRASQLDVDADLFRGVFASRMQEADLPEFYGLFKLTSGPASATHDILTLPDGHAALSAFYPDQLRACYLFASPLRREYTDWVSQPLFVPTLYNMMLFSTPTQQPYYTLTRQMPPVEVDDVLPKTIVLRGPFCPNEKGTPTMLSECMPQVQVSEHGSRMQLANLVQRAGCYRMEKRSGTSFSVALNYSRRESLLTYVDDDALPSGSPHLTTLDASRPVDLSAIHARSLSHLFLWAALILLLADVILSRPVRFLRRTNSNNKPIIS